MPNPTTQTTPLGSDPLDSQYSCRWRLSLFGNVSRVLAFLMLFLSDTVVGLEYSLIEVYQGLESVPAVEPTDVCANGGALSPYAWTLRRDRRKSVLDGMPTSSYAPTLIVMEIKNDGDKDYVFSLSNLKDWKVRIEGAETAREIPLLMCWEDDLKKEYVIHAGDCLCIPIGSHEWVFSPYIKRIIAVGGYDSCETQKFGTLVYGVTRRPQEESSMSLPYLNLIRIAGMREDGKPPKTLLRRKDGIGYSVAEDSAEKFVAGVAVLLVSNITSKPIVVPCFEDARWRIRLRRSAGENDIVVPLMSGKDGVGEDSSVGIILNPGAQIGMICGVLGMERLIRKGDALSIEFAGRRVTNELVF